MIYTFLISASRTASFLRVSHATVLRWLRHTDRNRYMRSVPKTDILTVCLRSMAESDPSFTLWRVNVTTVATTGVSVSQHLVHVALKTLGFSCKGNNKFHVRSSSVKVPTTAFMERRKRYEAKDVDLFCHSMRFVSDETVGAYAGIRGAARPFFARSNSRRTTTSLAVLGAVDSFGGLGFARSEGLYNSIHFIESLKTSSTSGDVLWIKQHGIAPFLFAFILLPILSEKSCISFLRSIFVSTQSKECFLS